MSSPKLLTSNTQCTRFDEGSSVAQHRSAFRFVGQSAMLLLAALACDVRAQNPAYPWIAENRLWWNTDPSTTPIVTESAQKAVSRTVLAGEGVCTRLYLPTDSEATSIEMRVLVNGTTWAGAHWGNRTPSGPSKLLGGVPIPNGGWHTLSASLADGLSSAVAPGSTISGSYWAMFRGSEVVRVWWDTCASGANQIAPVISFPGGNPHLIATGSVFNAASLYRCTDNKDATCASIPVTITPNALSTAAVGTFPVTYKATDSDGNTATATLQVVIEDRPSPANMGFVSRDVWLDSNWSVVQTSVQDLRNARRAGVNTYPASPDGRDLISVTDASQDQPWSSCGRGANTSNCGQRIYGYIIPPVTGTYTFYLSADRSGEFWINRNGTSQVSTNLELIGSVNATETNLYTDLPSATAVPTRIAGGEWNNTARPGYISSFHTASRPLVLTAGRPYYFEALAKNGAGGWQQLRLAWQGTASNPAQPNVPFDYIRSANLAAVASFRDTTVPTINLNGNPVTHTAGTPYTDRATCVDNVPVGCTMSVTAWGGMNQTNPVAGTYTLTLKATDKAGNTATTTRTVTVGAVGGFAMGSATLNRWNVLGTGTGAQAKVPHVITTASLKPFSATAELIPEATSSVTSLSIPNQSLVDLKGFRIHALLHPRVSGVHKFWVSGDQDVELYINYDANNNSSDTKLWNSAAELTKVASFCSTDFSVQYEWYKQSCQQSADINLQAGKAYYIAIISRERYNSDHIAVAWQEPAGGVKTTPPPTNPADPNQATWIVPGAVLSPIQ